MKPKRKTKPRPKLRGIRCPKCGSKSACVTQTRAARYGQRRQRQCAKGHRFETLEQAVHVTALNR